MGKPMQAHIDFEGFFEVPAIPARGTLAGCQEAPPAAVIAGPALPQSFVWQGEVCRVNWLKHKGYTFYQAGVSFADRSATLMVVKVHDTGELKPVLCWYGPPTNGVMNEEERQARAVCGLR